MGLTTTTGGDNNQPIEAIQCSTQCLSVCPLKRAIRLQQDAVGAHGMRSPSAREDRQARHMGLPFCGWMVLGDFARTLPNPPVPHQVDQERTPHQHSPIQPQEHHTTDHHPCRQNHGSHCRLYQGHQEHGQRQRSRRDAPATATRGEGGSAQPHHCHTIKIKVKIQHPNSSEGAKHPTSSEGAKHPTSSEGAPKQRW